LLNPFYFPTKSLGKVPESEEPFKITIKTFTGKQMELNVKSESTVADLKVEIENVGGWARNQKRLFFSCRELKIYWTLAEVGVSNNNSSQFLSQSFIWFCDFSHPFGNVSQLELFETTGKPEN
jgi:hypothetical protein